MDSFTNIIDYIDEQHLNKLESINVHFDNDDLFIKYKTKQGKIVSSIISLDALINEMPTLVKVNTSIIHQYIINHINNELNLVLL